MLKYRFLNIFGTKVRKNIGSGVLNISIVNIGFCTRRVLIISNINIRISSIGILVIFGNSLSTILDMRAGVFWAFPWARIRAHRSLLSPSG